MKKFNLLILSVVICLMTACHDKLWDAIDDLDSRVARLEELCKEMNTNISALQTIVSVIQENDFITGIVPIEKGGEVIGYTIMFGKHEPITIYNGEDGKDGQNGIDGKDGYTPILGVAKDVDGVYYWTLDGEWLLDAEGNKIRVTGRDGKDGADGKDGVDGENGKDGQNGQDGKPGVDGKDGITPQLKIENGYWYISYDKGATWTELGKAVGEDGKDGANGTDGKDGQDGKGADGKDGDSMFTSVTYDENNVYFTLTNGSVLIVPRGKDGGAGENDPSDIIKFEDLNVLAALLDVGVDKNGDNYISYPEAAEVEILNFKDNGAIKFFREFQYFTNVKEFCFYKCSNLYCINLPNTIKSIPSINDQYACFFNCVDLKMIDIPESCTKICESAFSGCTSLKKITLPSNIKRIEEYTFSGCTSLTSLNIPNSVNYIAANALHNLSIDTLTLPEQYSADPIFDLKNSKLTTIVWNSISYPTDFCKLTSGLGTSYYGIGGYYETTSWNGNPMGNTTTTTGLYNNTISIIIFGEKVESLPKYLCYKMSSLKTVYSKSLTPPIIDNNTFVNCNNIENVYVPTESVEAYKTEWSQFADKIVGYDF